MMTEKIEMVLIKRKKSKKDLAEFMNCSTSNIYNKLKRDNLSEKEMLKIAEALDCTLKISLVLNDSGEEF